MSSQQVGTSQALETWEDGQVSLKGKEMNG